MNQAQKQYRRRILASLSIAWAVLLGAGALVVHLLTHA